MYSLVCADEEEAGERSDRDLSPTPSTNTQTGHPRGTRSVARKRRSSSQTTSDRKVASYFAIEHSLLSICKCLTCVCFFQVRRLKSHGRQHLGMILWW